MKPGCHTRFFVLRIFLILNNKTKQGKNKQGNETYMLKYIHILESEHRMSAMPHPSRMVNGGLHSASDGEGTLV